MGVVELFIISVGLAMDAFAAAICKGFSMKRMTMKKARTVGAYFGIFQGGMPLIGYFLGMQFHEKITSIDHWIAFFLLGVIGINMIKESRNNSCEPTAELEGSATRENGLHFKNMLPLAIATSIDALAVGITLAFLRVNIIRAVLIIGIVTYILCTLGVKIGNTFGIKYKSKTELAGGFTLILMGIKILLEHTGIIHF
ncbi:manganese efflux pump MntP family protein [Irregularibacter muris]|uniref:Putative manganese efflux pump MntP n=1 Tax=Irregularibacter muris TaxID=1796619 RepID=A0AAE3HE19_9FIRM|nr:manganese efflux pump MntP family protein [Irregularibacter muris]MCR1898810.1 manganese efflux pump MntP family protein [Irregularibacter muris]